MHGEGIRAVEGAALGTARFRFFDVAMAAFGAWEVLLTPATYALVGWLKRREGIDVYDTATDFKPFKTQV